MRVTSLVLGICLIFLLTANAADDAESTYKARCATCHGANGDGNGHAQMQVKPQDLRADVVQKKSDDDLYSAIAFGAGHKDYPHAFLQRGLNSKQISELVAYIRTLATTSKKTK